MKKSKIDMALTFISLIAGAKFLISATSIFDIVVAGFLMFISLASLLEISLSLLRKTSEL